MKSEELLAHGDFVRTLARQLVFDEHRANDIAQQTWLAALKHPPGDDKSPRFWLGRVVRNFARKLHRSEARIRARERAAARPERVIPTEKVVSREEVRQRVVQTVLDLPEPYRSTLLFRYYENLPPREVAKQMDVPVETVRTRLKRGLEQMRQRLDALHEGGRKQWFMAVAPIAGFSLALSSAKASLPISSTGNLMGSITPPAVGALVMSTKIKIAAIILSVLVVTASFIHLLNWNDEPGDKHSGLNANNSGIQAVEEAVLQKKPVKITEAAEDMDLHEELKTAIPLEGSLISGTVVNKRTKDPVTAFHISLFCKDETGNPICEIQKTVMDEEGRFLFPLERGGTGWLQVMSSCYHTWNQNNLEAPTGDGLTGLIIELDPGYKVSGRVIDDGTGNPISGALVGPAMMPDEARLKYRLVDSPHESHFTETDEGGYFSLSGLSKGSFLDTNGKWRIAAAHDDYAEGLVFVEVLCEKEIEIRLKKGFRIFGNAVDDEGKPCPNLLISMAGEENPMPRPVLTGPDGHFTTPPTTPGVVFLHAVPPPGRKAEIRNFTEETRRVVVKDRDVEVNFGLTKQHVTWCGTFYDTAKNPITDGKIKLYPAGVKFWDAVMFDVEREVRTDRDGKFQIKKLLPGDYNLTLRFGNPKRHLDGGIQSFSSPGLVDRDLYIQGAAVHGIVVYSETSLPVIGKTGEIHASRSLPSYKMYTVPIDADGLFSIEGMEAGVYRISASVDGFPHVWGPEVKMGGQDVIRDYRIQIRPGGMFILKLTGFENIENSHFKYRIKHTDRDWYSFDWELIDQTGTWEYKREFVTGPGRVFVEFENGLLAEREYKVDEGAITKVEIRHDEINTPLVEEVTVDGTVIYAKGTPVADARITFFRLDRLDLMRELHFRGRTDSEGRFSVAGLKPGRWSVNCYLTDGGKVNFPELFIPPQPADPFPLDLVIPAGTICGRLFDKKTGLPFKGDDPRWSVMLYPRDSFEEIAEDRYNSSVDEKFSLIGIPQGTFNLRVFALGYQEYFQKNIRFTEGQQLDLGKIHLEPGPLLDLEVVDLNGTPIKSFEFFFNGKHIGDHRGTGRIHPGKRTYYSFPPGTATIRVSAKGFQEEKQEIELKAGESLKLRVELREE